MIPSVGVVTSRAKEAWFLPSCSDFSSSKATEVLQPWKAQSPGSRTGPMHTGLTLEIGLFGEFGGRHPPSPLTGLFRDLRGGYRQLSGPWTSPILPRLQEGGPSAYILPYGERDVS